MQQQELKKNIGLKTIIAITITSMMGTGFFFGAALGAKWSGVASLISWFILGLVVIYIAMIFGELISLFPRAGGVYEFAKHTYGNFTSFLVGWITWIVTNITTALVIVAAYVYVHPFITNFLFWANIPLNPFYVTLAFSILTIIVFNYITYKGNEGSGKLLGFFAALSIIVLLAIIIPGGFHINPENYTPFWAGSSLIRLAIAFFFISETFMGWEAASFLAEETRNAEKVIPKGLIISSIILVILGIASTIIIFGMIAWEDLVSSSQPLVLITNMIYGSKTGYLVALGIFLTLLGSSFGGVVSSPRLLMALARDKLFVEQISEIHPKYHTPHKAIIFQTIVSILIIILTSGKYETLLETLVPIALIMYLFVIISVPILRKKMPYASRPYKAPLGKFLPYVVAIIFLASISAWLYELPESILQFKLIISFILFGIPIYFLLLFHYDPDAIRKVNDGLSYSNLVLENFLLPKRIRHHILGHFRNLEGKTILEYGSGVGTLTMHLSELVGKKGKVIAVDMSLKNINLLQRRIKKKRINNVETIYDPYLISRIHPTIKEANIVFSVGMLSYIQNIPKFLKQMKQIIPENGGIVFVEYVDFFYIIPNIPWLSDNKKIERIFRDSGFSVRVERKKSLFWRYAFVYGINSEEDVPFI